jgi:hypothetical protein
MTEKLPINLPLLVALAIGFVVLVGLLIVGKVPVGYNLRNLAVRWITTLLTALAFTFVIFALTVSLAYVNGMYRLTEATGQPANVIVLSDGATDELFSNLSFTDTSDVRNLVDGQTLALIDNDRGDGRPLCSREAFIVVAQPIPGPTGEKQRRRYVQVRGIEDVDKAVQVHDLKLLPEGGKERWWSSAGVMPLPGTDNSREARRAAEAVLFSAAVPFHVPVFYAERDLNAIEAVLGEGMARELAKDREDRGGKEGRLKVGDVFELGPRKWVVVGVMDSASTTFGSEIWAKHQRVSEDFGKRTFNSMVLRTRNGAASADAVARALRDKDRTRGAALEAYPERDYYAKLSATNQQFLYAICFVAVFMAIGGVFGIMNTMFAAISQRTKDIGVLRILGFSRWQVLVSFFLESMVIALIGGILGCALGSLVNGITATSILSGGQGGGKTVVLRLAVDANTIAAGMVLTLLMGALGGLLPAWTAMRVRPLESLR